LKKLDNSKNTFFCVESGFFEQERACAAMITAAFVQVDFSSGQNIFKSY
jgi:hypothetical protein